MRTTKKKPKPKSKSKRKPKPYKFLGKPAQQTAKKGTRGLKTIVQLETIRNEEFSDLVEALRYHPGSEALAGPVRDETMDIVRMLIAEGLLQKERLEKYRREHKQRT